MPAPSASRASTLNDTRTPQKTVFAARETARGALETTAMRRPSSAGDDLDAQLTGCSKILPLSLAALDIYKAATAEDSDADRIAAAVECEASVAADLLHLGNSSYYNPRGEKISDLKQIVVRIGRRRVGELALAASACAAVSQELVPWLDMDLIWRRSISAGVALDLLVRAGRHQNVDRGLFLSAIMHPLGRVVLATLYPTEHRRLVEQCSASGQSLLTAEMERFGRSHAEIMAELLARWEIPAEITSPLHNILDPYPSLEGLREPHRTRAELVKLAMLLGRIAVGRWMPWDLVELPGDATVERLGIRSIDGILEETHREATSIANSRTRRTTPSAGRDRPQPRDVSYRRLSPGRFDFLAALMPSFQLRASEEASGKEPLPLLVNAMGVDPQGLLGHLEPLQGRRLIIVADHGAEERLSGSGPVVGLPANFGRLLAACQ